MESSSSSDASKKRYRKHGLNDCCKNLIGMFLNSTKESTRQAIRDGLKEFDIDVPRQTLSTWKKQYQHHGSAISPSKQTGAEGVIGTTVEALAMGYIVDSIERHIPITNKEVHKWVQTEAKIQCSMTTVWRLVRANGFSVHQARTKGVGLKQLADERAKVYYEYLLEVAQNIFLSYPRSQVASIDFTYTSHQTRVQKVVGYKGG